MFTERPPRTHPNVCCWWVAYLMTGRHCTLSTNVICCSRCVQNVPPEKLFSRERAVQQLLAIVDRTSMRENGRFFDWKGEEVEW